MGVEADIPSEATVVAVMKNLLSQLLENNVGHKKFYLDLTKAYGVSLGNNQGELEKHMWGCLESGLKRFQDTNPVMIVVDGLDRMQGGIATANTLSNKLALLAVKYSGVQVITMSRDASLKPTAGETQSFAIKPDYTHEDLRIVIGHRLEHYKYFCNRSEHEQEQLVERLLHGAQGDFLWAILTTILLKREATEDGFNKAIKAAKDARMSLDDTIAKLLGMVDLAKPDVNLLVSLLLNAARPLAAVELKYLLQIDLAKRYSVERKTDIAQDIKAALDPLVVVRNGFVRFYHPIVRSYMLKVQAEGKKLRDSRSAASEMAKRLLAYCNFNLSRTKDVSLEPIAKSEADLMFSTHPLLEYAVRTWTFHLRSSNMCHSTETLQLDDDFKAIFPSTTQLSMLEWSCWGHVTSRSEAIRITDFALLVRKAVFSEQHVAVLQTLIACGNILRVTTQTTEAADCFYRASIVGQHVLSKFHTIIAVCTTTFLGITEAMAITTRTELVTRREKMLIYTIDMYKHQHGKTHDLVIQYYKKLAQLYVDIREEHKAESVWRELREIVIIRFGKGSEEEMSISENLTVVLKKGDKKTDVIEYEQDIFGIINELEVWNVRRIKLTIELAMSYEARGEFILAEELYIFLWRRLTEECHHRHHHHGIELHIQLIDVVVEYVRFLRRCNRHQEASNVLICVWTEYEDYDFEAETIFLRFRVVGELMRSVGLLSVAVTIFKKCLAWFKSRDMHDHITSCELIISETMEEITKSTTTSITTTSVSTRTSSEIVIREAFESTLSRDVVTVETISICKGLISSYMKLEQWFQAIEVTEKSLLVIWRSVLTSSGTVALPKSFGTEAIDIAISLAVCHRRSHHFYQAEEIYVRIYRACRNSCRIDDTRLSKAYTVLIAFYEEHHYWRRIFEVYKELLKEYRRHLGAKHHLTIEMLYKLGNLCAAHGYGEAHEYYEEIVLVLNQGSHLCHADALDALMYLCRYNYEVGLWQKLQVVCKTLWETWKGHHHSQSKFTVDFVETLYFRYRYVLEHHIHCEYSVLRELTIDYRNTCLKVFGATATIMIKAKIELAQICMRSEKHIHEAITIYEEVLTQTKTSTTTTIVSTTTIATIKQQLTEAYTTVCSHDSVSVTTVERAITIVSERYEYLRITYGWAHVDTLASLRQVLVLWKKSQKQDSSIVVVRLLLEATVQIINKERQSQKLYDSGRTIGQIFLTCGMSGLALELVQEIRSQIITGAASKDNKHGIKIDKSAGTLSFVFLVTLEQAVRGALSASYSQVMADYLTESILYQSYNRSLSSSSAINIISHAARLRAFLLSHERHSQREALESQSYEIFVKKWEIKVRSRDIGLAFYTSLLVQIGDTIRDLQIGNIACQASVTEVRRLLESGQPQRAYEVAECAFGFIDHHKFYHHLQNVPLGFKLSTLMAVRGFEHSNSAQIDPKLREIMLELSRNIIRGVLQACKESKIDFVRLKLQEINDLVSLLGEQQNYADLEVSNHSHLYPHLFPPHH